MRYQLSTVLDFAPRSTALAFLVIITLIHIYFTTVRIRYKLFTSFTLSILRYDLHSAPRHTCTISAFVPGILFLTPDDIPSRSSPWSQTSFLHRLDSLYDTAHSPHDILTPLTTPVYDSVKIPEIAKCLISTMSFCCSTIFAGRTNRIGSLVNPHSSCIALRPVAWSCFFVLETKLDWDNPTRRVVLPSCNLASSLDGCFDWTFGDFVVGLEKSKGVIVAILTF